MAEYQVAVRVAAATPLALADLPVALVVRVERVGVQFAVAPGAEW
jgi:hypothetical protein